VALFAARTLAPDPDNPRRIAIQPQEALRSGEG